MKIILGVETTGPVSELVLCRGTEIVWESTFPVNRVTETLPEMMRQLQAACRQYEITPDIIGVNSGPGSFSGTRAGIAWATAYAKGQDLPIFGVDALTLLCWGIADTTGKICTVLDARRGQVYGAAFIDRKLIVSERLWTPAELAAELDDDYLLVGPGAPLLVPFLPSARRGAAELDSSHARTLAVWWSAHADQPLPAAVPRYVRGAVG